MGVYINRAYSNIFKNNHEICEPNQVHFKYDYLQEILKEQKQTNETLSQAFVSLKAMYEQQKFQESEHWNELAIQLQGLQDLNRKREQFEHQALDYLANIKQQEDANKQQYLERFTDIEHSYQSLLAVLETTNEKITVQEKIEHLLIEQDKHQQASIGTLNEQMNNQQEVLMNFHREMSQQDKSVNEKLKQIIKQNHCFKERMDHLNNQEASYQSTSDLVRNIDERVTAFDSQLANINDTIEQHVADEEQRYDEVLTRMSNQEALVEKVVREMSFLRSIIFERASVLAEKIETGYKRTSSYVQQLIHGSAKGEASEKEKIKIK